MKRLLLVAVVILILVVVGTAWLFDTPKSFDATAWGRAGGFTRHRMCLDITRRRLLQGKTLPQVKSLLGPPPMEKPDQLRYFLGQKGGTLLRIQFKDGEVSSVEVSSWTLVR